MLKDLRIGVIAVALVALSGGVAAADPTPVQEVHQSVVTDDGFQFNADLTKMTINSVPNMAATAFTREAFLNATATQTIADSHLPVNKSTVTAGKLDLAVQLGCQVNLTDGMQLGINTDQSIDVDNVLDGVISSASPTLNDFVPNFTVTLKPGTSKYVRIGRQEITKADNVRELFDDSDTLTLRVTVHDAYINVDSCGGPVSARLVAVAQWNTQTSEDELSLYSDILSI